MTTRKWMFVSSLVIVVFVAVVALVPLAFAQGPVNNGDFPAINNNANAQLGQAAGPNQMVGRGNQMGQGRMMAQSGNASMMAQQGQGTGFVDNDGDGVCDNAGTGRGQGFVDNDGDGVCDNAGSGQGAGQGRGSGFTNADGDGVCDHLADGQQPRGPQRNGQGRGRRAQTQ